MKKSKKADAVPQVFKYLLAVFASVVIFIFGYKALGAVADRACIADLAKFKIDIKYLDTSIPVGSKELQKYDVPCDADEIYFLETERVDPEHLSQMPLIKNSVESKAQNNIFIVKGGKIKSSFYTSDFEVEWPYYKCLVSNFGKMSFFLEGTQKSALITAANNQPECTLIPVQLSVEQSEAIIDEVVGFNCGNCPDNAIAERASIEHTREKIDISRIFSLGDTAQKTKVEIIFKVKDGSRLTNFRYYESLPKECVDDLSEYLEPIEADAIIYIKKDPLIVMYFDELKETKKLSYTIKKKLSEECRQLIKGLGVAQSITHSAESLERQNNADRADER